MARRTRAGGASPRTRAELYQIARQHDLAGQPEMGRDELTRQLGES